MYFVQRKKNFVSDITNFEPSFIFITGIGLGMLYLPFIGIVSLYFEKRRSLALGIAASGMGIGTFVYPPFLTWLEEQMHWRGAMIVLSGLLLNIAVCGALARHVDPPRIQHNDEDKSEGKRSSVSESGYSSSITESTEGNMPSISSETAEEYCIFPPELKQKLSTSSSKESDLSKITPKPIELISSSTEDLDNLATIGHTSTDSNKSITAVTLNSSVQDKHEMAQECQGSHHIDTTNSTEKSIQIDVVDLNSYLPSSTQIESPSSNNKCLSNREVFKNLVKNPYFVTFAVSNFLTCMTFLMPPVYMADRAKENGVEKSKAALALSMYGAGNLFGRLAFGFLGDHVLDGLSLNSICLIMCGVSTCLSPLCGANAVLHGMYGFTVGTFIGKM